jgi:ABC-type proline/glycine betaine transport system substrate-binding protein
MFVLTVEGCKFDSYTPDPVQISGKKCFDGPLDAEMEAFRKSVNSARTFDPVLSVGDWVSAQIVNLVVKILLEEFMGYSPKLDFVTGTGALYGCVADGTHTFNLETWVNTKQTQREAAGKAVEENPLGYYGQEGIFISQIVKTREALTSDCLKPFIEQWQVLTFREALDLIPKDQTTKPAEPYLCTNDIHKQCFSGRFIPLHCCADDGCDSPSPHCHEVLMASPGWNTGWYESMISNLGLNLTLSYVGTDDADFQGALDAIDARGQSSLFYWFSPHPLLASVDGTRISFPQHSDECQKSHNANPSLSGTNCDLRSDKLQNLYPSDLLEKDKYLHRFIKKMSISQLMIDSMLDATTMGGGTLTIDETACSWVKENFKTWKTWVPPFVVEPTVVVDKDNKVLVLAILIPLLLVACAVAGGAHLKSVRQTRKVAQLSTELRHTHLRHEEDLLRMGSLPKMFKNAKNDKNMTDFVSKAHYTSRMRSSRNKTGE